MAHKRAPMYELVSFDKSTTQLEVNDACGWKVNMTFSLEVSLSNAEYNLLRSMDDNRHHFIDFLGRQHNISEHQAECIYRAVRSDL